MPEPGKGPRPSKAVFLDRDGTINKNTHYLIEFGDFELLPGVAAALRILQDLDYRLFVVSNQSGVARGFFSFEAVEELHRKASGLLASQGIRIDEWAFCPHHPEGVVERFREICGCRKPEPGMLIRLAEKHGIALDRSYMVGDSETDALAGIKAGARSIWLRPEGAEVQAAGRVDNRANIKEFVSLLDFAESLRILD